jgi:hypothetical protein
MEDLEPEGADFIEFELVENGDLVQYHWDGVGPVKHR